MSEQRFDEMIYAYSAGCLDKDDLLDFLDYSNSGGKLTEKKLGELQNLTSMLPLILEVEMPHPQVRDKFARRLFRLRDEVRVKAKANQRNAFVNIPPAEPVKSDETEMPVEVLDEEVKKDEIIPVEFKKEEQRKEEFKKPEIKKEEIKKPEVKIEDKKVEVPPVKKPEIIDKKADIPEKKEPVKDFQVKNGKEEKKPFKEELKKEDKKGYIEKEPVKVRESIPEKDNLKDKYKSKYSFEEEEEEEKKGIPKFAIIGVVLVVIAVAAYFLTSGGSKQEQVQNKPAVDSSAVAAKQQQIQQLNQQLASLQNSEAQNSTASNNPQDLKKVDDLTKELQALKEEMARLNQAKNQTPQQTQAQQTQTQQAPVQEQPKTEPVAEQPKQEQAQPTVASAARGGQVVNANSPAQNQPSNQYLTFAEEMPTPVGGMANMLKKVNVPESAISAGKQGRVVVKAYIDESGNVNRTSVIRGLGYGCDEVAEFVVKSTKFVPGKNAGRPVKVEMSIAIPFKL